MSGTSRTLITAGILLLACSPNAVAQTSAPQDPKTDPKTEVKGKARQEGVALGRVVRARGKVLVELPDKSWDPLKADQVLKNGQRVKVGKQGSLELTVADDAAEAKRPRAYTGDRVIVKAGSVLVVGPVGTTADLALERGALFGQSLRDLKVRLGVSVLELGAGDASVELKPNGKATVLVHQGTGQLRLPQKRVTLAGGDRVRLSSTGEAKVRSGTMVRLPKYVVAADALTTARALLLRETFRSWKWSERWKTLFPQAGPGQKPYEEAWMRAPKTKAQRRMGVALGLPGTHDRENETALLARGAKGPREVRFGRSTPQGGLFAPQPGAVLRVTYRVDVGPRVRLRMTGTEFGHPVDDPKSWLPGRTKLWTVVEFPLREALKKNPITYLSFDAGADGKDCLLEVREIVVYVPEGAP